MPVILCSSLTQRGATVTIEALSGGASDYVTKPAGQSGREAALRTLAQELIPKIRALTNPSPNHSSHRSPVPVPGPGPALFPRQPVFPAVARAPLIPSLAQPHGALLRQPPISSVPTVVAIGVSTGGPAALDVLLPMLPASFALPVLIVQHMPELFTRLFAERLNGRCNLRVREASEADPVCPGAIYIARGNWHLEAQAASIPNAPPTLRLSQGPLENHCRPSVDVLFRSVASVYGSGVLAVVLTGMGSDGLLGCRIVREQGGSVLAQDESSSTVWGMPGAVTGAGLAHKVLPLRAIAPEILRIAGRARSDGPLSRDPLRPVVS
jgi:two-component system chemotaxis response regulator CheB